MRFEVVERGLSGSWRVYLCAKLVLLFHQHYDVINRWKMSTTDAWADYPVSFGDDSYVDTGNQTVVFPVSDQPIGATLVGLWTDLGHISIVTARARVTLCRPAIL